MNIPLHITLQNVRQQGLDIIKNKMDIYSSVYIILYFNLNHGLCFVKYC